MTRHEHSAARTMAAVLGAPAVAFAVGAALVVVLPGPDDLALAIGAHVILPVWVALACALPLSRSGARAWSICAGLVIGFGALVWLGGPA